MFTAIAIVLFIAIIVLLYLTRSFRLDLKYRRLHIRQVLATIIFSLLTMFGFSYVLSLVNKLLSIGGVRDFLFKITPLQNVLSVFYFAVTMLVNIVFLSAFLGLLYVVNDIWLEAVKRKVYTDDYLDSDDSNFIEKFFNRLSDLFYNGNTLKPIGEVVGAWVRGMKKFFGAFLILEFVAFLIMVNFKIPFITDLLLSNMAKNFYIIPMVSYVILQQVEIFLCGDRRIDEGLVETDEIKETVIGDYMPLIKIYESVFGNGALISYYLNNGDEAKKSLYIGVTDEQLAKVKNRELLNAVYRNIENRVNHVSPKFLDCVVDLINGKSISVVDSMCGEFNFYYLAYLQHSLSLRNKALVICDDDFQVAAMVKKYKDIFVLINRASELWRIGDINYLRDTKGHLDVLICTEEQLLDGSLKNKYPRFFADVKNVNIVDTYAFLARDKAFLTRLFDYLDEGNEIQYVFNVEENNPDIKTALEEIVKTDIVVYENHNESKNICIMYWKAESAYKTQLALLPNLNNDFGVAYTIATIAAKYEVSDINIQAPATVPVLSYRNTATSEYALAISREFFNREDISLENVVSVNDTKVFGTNELAFNIIYDANNNLLALTNMWLSYGGRTCSLIHLVSRKYLLRDYFAYNLASLCGRVSAIKKFVPVKVLNIKAAATAFLIKSRKGVLIDEVLEFGHFNSLEEKTAEDILNRLLSIAFDREGKYDIYSIFAFDLYTIPKFENDKYIYSHIVRMTDQSIFEALCEKTADNAVFNCASQCSPLGIHKDDIYNYYLPNQLHAFGGRRYKVSRIEDGEIVGVKDDSVFEEKEYTNLYNIEALENATRVNKLASVENEKYSINYYEGDLTRKIWGYFEYSNGIDFGDKNNTETVSLAEPIVEKKHVNYIDIKFDYEFRGYSDKVAATLVVVVRGLLETMLPQNYKNLLVFSKLDKENMTKIVVEGTEEADHEGETNDLIDDERLFYLFPDINSSEIKENERNSIHLYIVDFSTVETGSIAAIGADIERLLTIMKQYILWDVTRDEKDSYLSFGLEQRPMIFDVARFSSMIDNIAPKENVPEKVIDENFSVAQARPCSFCGKPILGSGILLDDGRAMCQACAKHRATTKKEVTELLKKAYALIESRYDVKVPDGIKIKFARREEIQREAGYGVIGYYSPSQHLIKVLRGGPEANVLATLIHELTHAWQWREGKVGNLETYIKEGHSMYTEVECMRDAGYEEYANHIHETTINRDDEYGEGYRYWLAKLEKEEDKNIFRQIVKL